MYYSLGVPGLAEKRPSVLKGDSIKVQASNSGPNDKWFDGTVSDVLENSACVSGRGSALRRESSLSSADSTAQLMLSGSPTATVATTFNSSCLEFPLVECITL